VVVEIIHDLHFRVPLLAPIAEPIIGTAFIHPVASKTLRCMKMYLESQTNSVLQPQVQHD
jgi:hypothetical protein